MVVKAMTEGAGEGYLYLLCLGKTFLATLYPVTEQLWYQMF